MSLFALRKKRGDPWDAETWNRQLEEIDRYLTGLNLTSGGRGRRSSPGPVYLALRVDSGTSAGEWLLRVGFGLVGALEPQIGGHRLSEVQPDTGDTPALTVHAADFSLAPKSTGDWPKGVSFIYARTTFNNPTWDLLKVEIIARATPWTTTPWQAARLIGLLQRDDPEDPSSDVSVVQLTLFNQALTLTRKSSAGLARYWFRCAA